jgi:VWFA-related protein
MNTADATRRAWFATACLILSIWIGGPFGAPAPQSSERPLVVDFYALGTDGVSIADLKAEELTIKLDGRTRTIRSLRLIKQADLPQANPLAARQVPLPVPFATNGIAEAGRSFVIVIDDESFRPGRERPIRAALAVFLGALSPRDRVSLWTTPHGGMKVDLTQNHDRVSQALQLVVGHGPDNETGSDAACRARTDLEATEHMLSQMAGGEGPTTVIYLTASLFGPRRDSAVTRAPGMCELTVEHFQRVGRMAASARAHFYIVQTEDLVGRGQLASENIAGAGFAGSENPLEGMENLAGVTGGTRLSLSRAGDQSLVPIARATASFYSATIEGASSDIDGPHGLDVKVARNGVAVRSRALLNIRKPAGPTVKPATPEEMAKSSTVYPDLPMRVAGFASLYSGDGQMQVVAAAEPIEPNVKFASLSAALFDSTGKMAGMVNANEGEMAQLPALTAMIVSSGTYRLRVAATDTAGRAGAADIEIVAETVTAGPLKLSSLVLGVSREAKFLPRLQFSTEPVAIAYLDMFGNNVTAPVGAIIEVLTSTGAPLATNRLALEATQDRGRFRAMGAVPIGALPPGDYIARAVVMVEGQSAGVVLRAFRKVGQ